MSALNSLTITWHVDDVIDRANDTNHTLTRAQAQRVLVNIGHYHDANSGINWAVIDTHIELYLANQKQRKQETKPN